MKVAYKINGQRVSRKKFVAGSTQMPECTGNRKRLEGGWHTLSDGIGIHPSQADEAEAIAKKAGVPTTFDRETGQAQFTSEKHRRKYIKLHGFYDKNGLS